jgi:hypothetical protein
MGLMPADTILFFAIVNLDQGRFSAVKAKSRKELAALLKEQGFEPINIEVCGEIYKDGRINHTNPQKFDEQTIRRMLGLKKQSSEKSAIKGIDRIVQRILLGNGSEVKRLRIKEKLYASILNKKHSECANTR